MTCIVAIEDKVKMALETAEACNAGVARPFTILRGAEAK
jgi:hypothetical protein